VIPAGIAARPLQRGENGGGGADWWGHGVSGAGRRRAMRATRWRAGPGEQAGASACWAAREGERARATGIGKECGRVLAEGLAWARAGLGRGKGKEVGHGEKGNGLGQAFSWVGLGFEMRFLFWVWVSFLFLLLFYF